MPTGIGTAIRRRRVRRRRRRTALIKSNNPHLAGGEKPILRIMPKKWSQFGKCPTIMGAGAARMGTTTKILGAIFGLLAEGW